MTENSELANESLAKVLASASTASDAIRGMYDACKRVNPKISLGVICRRAGVASRGNLSDVMGGKRQLHRKYHDGIVKAFDLKGKRARCLRLMLALDHEQDPNKRRQLVEQLQIVQKALVIKERRLAPGLQGLFTGLEVFCSFGLFGNAATSKQLESYFPDTPPKDIGDALALLTSLDLIERSEDNDVYHVKSSHIVFGASTDFSHVEFLKLALSHAAKNVERWFAVGTHSYFDSTVISVKERQFVAVLAQLKADMLLRQAELESGNADMLVRFNVQIYPIGGPSQGCASETP